LSRRPCIGLDLWPGSTHAPGLGRYARELVRALARLPRPPRLKLLDVGPGPRPLRGEIEPLPSDWTCVQSDLPRGALASLARLGLPPERLLGGCDLFHRVLPAFPPLGSVPWVQALSELPPRGSQTELDLARALRAGGSSSAIVVFSSAARSEVQARFDLDAARVETLPVGCDHWWRKEQPRDVPPGPPRIVALGRTDAGRGPLSVLAGFERARARGADAQLVWCGRPGDQAGELRAAIASSAARAAVTWIEDPQESELPALVASASVLVHLSREEWTPVTPLEGLGYGAALVASPLPAFREAVREEAVWLAGDPASIDAGEMAGALELALAGARDPALRRRRRVLASAFTWTRHAELTSELWSRLLGA
jgi:glycosyltransferase involved in cell wall biosynthesis